MIQGDVRIGENSYVNDSGMLLAQDGYHIEIGKDCAIGHWVYMNTRMHKTDNHLEYFKGNIHIGDHVWVGNGAVIYPNVTVGDGAVIGAHCVIAHDIPPNMVVYVTQEMRPK